MARQIHTTLQLTGKLVAETPIHVGGAGAGLTVDMPLAMDGQGRHYLPGTSLAGALRNWVRSASISEDWSDLWGGHEKDKGASLLVVDDAALINPQATAELWHGVGMDRYSNTAADGIKFDRQVLPRGSRFAFRVQIEARNESELEQARKLLGQITAAMKEGLIRFGAGSTRGLGAMCLEEPVGHETAWNSRAGVLAFLRNTKHDFLPEWMGLGGSREGKSGRIEITLHWQPRGPLMSKASADGLAVDFMPFVSAVENGEQALTLPGSAIKGALRSHAERIVRTLLGVEAPRGKKHMDQITLPLVDEIFGHARSVGNNATGEGKTAQPAGRRGALTVATCYAKSHRTSAKEWNELAQNEQSWNKRKDMSLQRAYHVAVDRWTGGVVDGALYSAVEPMAVKWEPIRVSLDLGNELPRFALVWLLLREMVACRITLGFGANRGYGEIAVTGIGIKGLPPEAGDSVTLESPAFGGSVEFNAWLKGSCAQAWSNWLEEHATKEVANV